MRNRFALLGPPDHLGAHRRRRARRGDQIEAGNVDVQTAQIVHFELFVDLHESFCRHARPTKAARDPLQKMPVADALLGFDQMHSDQSDVCCPSSGLKQIVDRDLECVRIVAAGPAMLAHVLPAHEHDATTTAGKALRRSATRSFHGGDDFAHAHHFGLRFFKTGIFCIRLARWYSGRSPEN